MEFPTRNPAAFGIVAAVLAACTAPQTLPGARPTDPSRTDLSETLPLFTAADALEKKWRPIQVWSESSWQLVVADGEIAIEPRVDKSSTALTRWVEFDTKDCPVAEWSWRVDTLPAGADLASREAEDMAASVMFVFGDPGSFTNPNPVPTIRYVWSSGKEPMGALVNSPYFPENLRSIVVRSGPGPGGWITERRSIAEDFHRAFGRAAPGPVEVFALYSDNDHLGQPVRAQYRWARMRCSKRPDDSILGVRARTGR